MDSETSHKKSKKKAIRKHKTSKKKRKHDSSGDESVDISDKIFPIAHYIDDREEMIKQVFSVMETEKLNCMLPPILKGMAMSVLKDHCLRELRNMTDNEVRKVLCGEPLETTSGQASVPPKIHIDCGESVSSVEECHNEDKEKRTLLDILEQEMQEIAYNTVMRKDRTPSVEGSEDELPEVVAIIPTGSPSKTKNNVPVICIDSGDDECAPSTSPSLPQKSILDERCNTTNSTINILGDIGLQGQGSLSFVEKQPIIGNKQQSDNVTQVKDSLSNNQMKGSLDLNQTISQTQESVLTKVILKKSSAAERVVKNVQKSHGKVADDFIPVNKNVHTYANTTECETEGGESSEVEITHEDIVQSDDSISESESSTTQFNGVCDTSASQGKETHNDLQNSDVPCEDTPQSHPVDEKEEGEISEEESEEDVAVLETARDSNRSPTISLSSGCSDRKSDSERPESRVRVRKHRHRHRRSRRETDSPERSRRRIEKRGNRSYRRKTSSSVKRRSSTSEKVKEVSEENVELRPSTYPEMPIVALEDIELPPSKTPPLEAESNITTAPKSSIETLEDCKHLKSDKEKTKEDIEVHKELSNASENLNNILKSKLDSLEDAEASDGSEPVSCKTSWADRWAEKKDLKKVAITSKICRNVRKKFVSARRKQTTRETSPAKTPVLPPVPPLVLHVEGSVKEYKMLQLLVSDAFDEEPGDSSREKTKNVPSEEVLVPHRNEHEVHGKTVIVNKENETDSPPATLKEVSEEQEVSAQMECK